MQNDIIVKISKKYKAISGTLNKLFKVKDNLEAEINSSESNSCDKSIIQKAPKNLL